MYNLFGKKYDKAFKIETLLFSYTLNENVPHVSQSNPCIAFLRHITTYDVSQNATPGLDCDTCDTFSFSV